MLQVVTTGAYYPPVVTAGRFLLQEHPMYLTTGTLRIGLKKNRATVFFLEVRKHKQKDSKYFKTSFAEPSSIPHSK